MSFLLYRWIIIFGWDGDGWRDRGMRRDAFPLWHDDDDAFSAFTDYTPDYPIY